MLRCETRLEEARRATVLAGIRDVAGFDGEGPDEPASSACAASRLWTLGPKPSISRMGAVGTTTRLPIRRQGISPELTAMYAVVLEMCRSAATSSTRSVGVTAGSGTCTMSSFAVLYVHYLAIRMVHVAWSHQNNPASATFKK